MNVIQKLRQLHTDIAAAQDRLKIVDAWALAERLALRLPVNLDEAQRVFAEKDADGLDALIAKLEAPPKPAESLPEYTEARIYPCLSFLQAALLAFDRGLIKQDDVWPVLRDVRRRGLSNAETANHRDDAVKRFGLNLEGLEAWP